MDADQIKALNDTDEELRELRHLLLETKRDLGHLMDRVNDIRKILGDCFPDEIPEQDLS